MLSSQPLKSEGRTPADNQTARHIFVMGPDKKIKLVLVCPMTTGRNFDEVLGVIDSLQLTAKHKVATPVNWKQGDNVIIAGSVSDEELDRFFRKVGKLLTLHLNRPAVGLLRIMTRIRASKRRVVVLPCFDPAYKLISWRPVTIAKVLGLGECSGFVAGVFKAIRLDFSATHRNFSHQSNQGVSKAYVETSREFCSLSTA
jgi:hypothetical protein